MWTRVCIIELAAVMTLSVCRQAPAQGADTLVARHRAVYQRTEQQLSSYRHAEADMDSLGLERRSTDGGDVEAFCEGTTIRLLVAYYAGETSNAEYRFYFDHDSLLFVYAELRWGRPNGVDPYPPRTHRSEDRFYFRDDQLVRWIGADHRRQPLTTTEAQKRRADLLATAAELRHVMPGCSPHPQPEPSSGDLR